MNSIKEGYKQTEIGVIPEDWEVKTLGEVCEIRKGQLITEETRTLGLIPVIAGGKKPAYYHNKSNRLGRTITVSGSGANAGYVSFHNYPIFASDCSTIEDSKSFSIDFIFYFLQLSQERIYKLQTGGAQPHIHPSDLYPLVIYIPTLAEQTAIANALSDTDGLITGLEKLIAKKRNIKQGAMQQLLQPKEGWEIKKLGEIAEIVRGASPRPIEDPKWFDENSSIGWVRISDVTKSVKVLNETIQKLSELGIKSSRYVEKDNLIMSICATVGRPILTKINVCIHDGFVVFRNPKIEKEYLYYFLIFIEKDWSKNGQVG